MPTEEINILNIDVEPSQPEGFDVQLDLQTPRTPTLNLGVVLPIGEGGAIKSISRNGVELPIVEGNVDITVPTKVSELDNDSGFITSSAIAGKANTADLSQVAFSGDYNDLDNKPEIPSLTGYATETYVGNAVSTHNSSADAHSDIRQSITTINRKIPSQATPDNQLADKNFVNSSIATETATFRGTYNEVTDLNLQPEATHSMIETALHTTIANVDNNDYCFVQIPTRVSTPTEIESVERYKYSTIYGWQYEYTLNNSGFTAAQWAAINSGITSGLVTQIGTNASDILTIQGAIQTLTTGLSGKVDKAGDTMTGALLFDTSTENKWIGAKRGQGSIISRDCIYWSPVGGSTFFGQMNSDYTGIQTTFARINNSNGLIMAGTRGVFENDSATEANRLQRYDKIFATGIVSDTKTWTSDNSSYTVSNPVSGPIPLFFIDMAKELSANFNTTTGYFELNGLTDITYAEMKQIYSASSSRLINNASGMWLACPARTNFWNNNSGTSWGNITLSSAFRASSFEMITLEALQKQNLWVDDTITSAEALGNSYQWQGGVSWASTFQECSRLKHIRGIMHMALKSSSASTSNMFYRCNNLETVWLYYQDRDVNFNQSSKLNLQVLEYIAMHRFTGSGASTTFNVTVHPTVYAACQADTTVYTKGGNNYTGIMALATASNFAIVSA